MEMIIKVHLTSWTHRYLNLDTIRKHYATDVDMKKNLTSNFVRYSKSALDKLSHRYLNLARKHHAKEVNLIDLINKSDLDFCSISESHSDTL